MASAGKFLKAGCLALVGLALLIAAALGLILLFQNPPVPFAERLAALPAAERALLEEVARAAGMKVEDLRDVGVGADCRDERNHKAVAVDQGHVRLLSLQGVKLATLPAFSAWTGLEKLSLRGCALTTTPDLSGCTALQEVNLSQNQIASLTAATLPPAVKKLDLSENPLSDLAPLSGLKQVQEIAVRKAKVAEFTALLDLELPLLDLRDNPVTQLPERFPRWPHFRVDLEGCPVFTPPGYLRKWSFKIKQSGVPGGVVTRQGILQLGAVDLSGTWKVVPALASVELPATKQASDSHVGAVDVEVKVATGKLRVYLNQDRETRGPWFQKGFVKGTDGFFQNVAKLYADAEPGKPARLHGQLEHFNGGNFYFYVEPLPGEPVTEMSYRVWREK